MENDYFLDSFSSIYLGMICEVLKLFFFLQRCVVVQEVYPDGLIASDGRLQPGDQIIEINGIDMTCAPHAQVI